MSAPSPLMQRLFGLDLRALALFRIALGGVLLADLVLRGLHAEAHYGAAGAFPLPDVLAARARGVWSLYDAGPAVTAVGLGLQGLAAAALMVGWHTRAATVAAWVLWMSLQARAPLVLTGADTLLRALLWWGMFLPLGATASVDAWRARARAVPPPRGPAVSVASAALVLQVGLVYLVTMALKTDPSWWDGSAVGEVLEVDLLVTRVGRWARTVPGLAAVGTWVTVTWELLGVALAWSPVATARTRTVAVVGFVVLHTAFGAMLGIGLFPVVSVVSWLPLLPGLALDRLGWPAPDQPAHPAAPSASALSTPAQALAAGALALVLVGQAESLGLLRSPRSVDALTRTVGLDQRWNMFAPGPPDTDGWYVFEGTTASGARVDLMPPGLGGPVSHERPAHGLDALPGRRWAKVWLRLRRPGMAHRRGAMMRWALAHHARLHPGDPAVSARWVFHRERPDGTVVPEVLWAGDATTPDAPPPSANPILRRIEAVRGAAER